MHSRLKFITLATATLVALPLSSLPPLHTPPSASAQTAQDRKAEADRLLRDGINDYADRQYQSACQSLQQALASYQSIQNRQGEATALLHMGGACLDDKTVNYYQKSLAIFRRIKNREGEAEALRRLGDLYFNLTQYKKAVPYLEKALPIFSQINDRAAEKDVLASLIAAHMFLQQTEKLNFYVEKFEKLERNSQQPDNHPSSQLTELDTKLTQRGAEGDALRDKETKRLLERGIQQYRAKDASLDEGDKSWERALGIYRVVQDLNGEARLLLGMGDACRTLRKCRKAAYYYEKAVLIFQQLNDRASEAKALFSLASTYLPKDGASSYRQEVEKAIVPYQRALAIYQQLKDQKSEAQTLLSLGLVYAALSNYKQAISSYNQALPIVQSLKDPKSETTLLFRLGLAYDLQSKYPEAIRYYQQAIPIFSQIPALLNDGDIEGATMKNLGIIYDSLSKNEESIEYYKKALSTYQKYKNRPGEVIVLVYLAKVYSRTRQHKEATDCYELALSIYRKHNTNQKYNTEIENILFSLGNSYLAMAKHQKAIRYYEELRAIYESNPNPVNVKVYAGLMTQLNNARRALSQPEKVFLGSMPTTSLYNSMGRDPDIEAYAELALFYQQNNQPELAIVLYKKVINIHETFRRELSMAGRANNPMGLDDQQSRAVQNSYKENVAGTYRALADLLLQQNRVVEALQVLDLLKVEDLQDFFSTSRSGNRFNEIIELLPEEKRISQGFLGLVVNNILSELLWKDFTTNANGDVFTARGIRLSRQRLADARASQASQRQLIKAFPEGSEIKSDIQKLKQTAPDQNLKLKAYQDLQTRIKKLGENITLFYPLVLDDRLELVILTRDRPPIRKPVAITAKQLETEIQTFRQQLEGRSPLIQQSAQKLYQSLFQPLESELKAAGVNTIVYAPDSIMRYVPLAALYDGKQWLTQRYQINYLTALALTPLEPDRNPKPRVLAAALTQNREVNLLGQTYRFAALQFTEPEVKNLAQLLPNTTTLIDEQFNRANLSQGVPQATILHLATHGMFVPGSPDQSIILLGDGSTINLREIEQQWKFPNLSLVVLSACETAIGGKLGNGIEVLGFGYQMQRTGSRAAVSSLWKVDDGGTQVLMNTFYGALQQGMTKARALQETQKALITGNYTTVGGKRSDVEVRVENRMIQSSAARERLSHPYYWAPFILIGNGL